MRKLSDLTAGCPSPGNSVVAPLSYNGTDGKKAAMGLRNRGLLCKAAGVREPFISSEMEVDVLED